MAKLTQSQQSLYRNYFESVYAKKYEKYMERLSDWIKKDLEKTKPEFLGCYEASKVRAILSIYWKNPETGVVDDEL